MQNSVKNENDICSGGKIFVFNSIFILKLLKDIINYFDQLNIWFNLKLRYSSYASISAIFDDCITFFDFGQYFIPIVVAQIIQNCWI